MGFGIQPDESFGSSSTVVLHHRGQQLTPRRGGSLTQLRHLLSYASRFVLPLTRKAGFRLAGWLLPGGSRTLWITAKGFRSYDHPPLLFS